MRFASLRQLFLLSILGVICVSQLSASSGGITGRSLTTSGGCSGGGCHGGSVPMATTVTIKEAVGGVINVIPNERMLLTLEVSNATKVAAGMNISVRRTLNGNLRAGLLDNNNDPGILFFQGELTHGTPRSFVDGKAQFQFGFRTPTEPGEYYLHATANAVNRGGTSDGDQWAYLTAVKIVVSGVASVSDQVVSSSALGIAPVPAHGSVAIRASTTSGEAVTVQIVDALGSVVRTVLTTSNEDEFLFVWDGQTDHGTPAIPGTYTVAVIGERKISYGRAIIVK